MELYIKWKRWWGWNGWSTLMSLRWWLCIPSFWRSLISKLYTLSQWDPSERPQTTTQGSYKVTLEKVCMTCGRGGNHSLGSCNKFQGMSQEVQWDTFKKGILCKKKLSKASKNCERVSCKSNVQNVLQVHVSPYTVAHKGAIKKEGTKKFSNDVTYTAWSKCNEKVLLMTCWVEVMAPDGSIIHARALIDSEASTSLIMKHLAKSCVYSSAYLTLKNLSCWF